MTKCFIVVLGSIAIALSSKYNIIKTNIGLPFTKYYPTSKQQKLFSDNPVRNPDATRFANELALLVLRVARLVC